MRMIAMELVAIAEELMDVAPGVPAPVVEEDPWMTQEDVAQVCPRCSELMASKGIKRIRASAFKASRRGAARRREVVKVDWDDERSVANAERQKARLEERGYTMVREIGGLNTSGLVYELREPERQSSERKAQWESLPGGWTEASLRSFWGSLTGSVVHKVTKCIAKMGDTDISDPGAFCASLARKLE